ncbi:hypothetical protein [Methylomonas sp. CM2]|uniref:hypothetical protein n=1 Tax=Methylomonas sp. CM2 TaxID=3417647 RepID=UPI003CF9DBA0
MAYLPHDEPERARKAALDQIVNAVALGYEPEIAQLLAYRDLDSLIDPDFETACRDWLQPIWRAAHGA